MSKEMVNQERRPRAISGFIGLAALLALIVVSIFVFVFSVARLEGEAYVSGFILLFLALLMFVAGLIGFGGLKVLQPNEALVLTLFGRYHGTLKKEGFYYVNPFVAAVNPAAGSPLLSADVSGEEGTVKVQKKAPTWGGKKMSLKTMTLTNGRQKINDALGNPIIIGIVVIWRIQNTAQAAFNVDNYVEYLSTQSDSALRNIVRLYPYDGFNNEAEKSLQGSSQEVADRIRREIQEKVDVAGIEVLEARITHLAYAPEIASAMLQRQQASAIIDARAMIVDGAVGMVQMALSELEKQEVVALDEERRAQMVSNLLVVLCGNHDVHPVVNSGSLY